MRRDFDFVAMSDYRADMKESAATAEAAIEYVRKRAERAERALGEIVLAAGGKVKVSRRDMHNPRRKIEFTIWVNDADDTITYEARTST